MNITKLIFDYTQTLDDVSSMLSVLRMIILVHKMSIRMDRAGRRLGWGHSDQACSSHEP